MILTLKQVKVSTLAATTQTSVARSLEAVEYSKLKEFQIMFQSISGQNLITKGIEVVLLHHSYSTWKNATKKS